MKYPFIVAEIDRLTRDNVRALRPGDGANPKDIAQFLGMQVTRDVQSGGPLSWDMVRD